MPALSTGAASATVKEQALTIRVDSHNAGRH